MSSSKSAHAAAIGAEDIEPLFEQYSAKGAKFRQKPTNHPWAYEMQVEDPDGHVLRFGSESKKGQGRESIWRSE